MKANRYNRGSVLMEFIIVIPIYLVLFGGVFMIGDMLVHATRLASAERVMAYDLQSEDVVGAQGWNHVLHRLFHVAGSDMHEFADDGKDQDSLSREDAGGTSYKYADTTVDCPWSLQGAMKIRDDYRLLVGGTAGRLAFANWFLGEGIGQPSSLSGDVASLVLGGSIGMHSKDESGGREYTYNYYTLKRTKYPASAYTWRDNRRPASDLVVSTSQGGPHVWRSQVADEKWHESVAARPAKNRDVKHFGSPGSQVEYRRYPKFEEWSE